MKAEPPHQPPYEYRVRAKRLLKQLKQSESEDATLEAAARFQRLQSFSGMTEARVVENRDSVKLKHALAIVALEEGYGSWAALKVSTEDAGPEMYDPRMDTFLNRWFASYEDARASLKEEGGFLLPYKNQFYVCEGRAIKMLGLNPDDPDWKLIGRDWVKPRDREAWMRLAHQREEAVR